MRRRAAFALVPGLVIAGAATLFLTEASAGPPFVPLVRVAVTNEVPVAGHTFTAITVTNMGTRITDVRCGNGTVGYKQVPVRAQRFYANGLEGPAAVTCSWKIPASARGNMLRLGRTWISYSPDTTLGSPVRSWRIR